jgi:hypothetical protein
VHDADRETFRQIDRGERRLDWAALLGNPDDADFLTVEGKGLLGRMAADMTAFFGAKWLPAATDPGRTGRMPVPGLDKVSPVLYLLGPVDAFTEAVRWWAGLQLLVERDAPGLRTVRRNLRNDIKLDRLLHTLVQARLATIGLMLGAEVELEPEKAGGPGDVLLRTIGTEVFLEVTTFSTAANLRQYERAAQANTMHLHLVESELDVHFAGDTPAYLSKHRLDAWRQQTRQAAEACARDGQPRDVPGDDGRQLSVRRGPAPQGTRLSAPEIESDEGQRILDRIEDKAAKVAGAATAWIWIEDHTEPLPPSAFQRAPLERKIDIFADLASSTLNHHPNVAGIIWSTEAHYTGPQPQDEDVENKVGYGVRRRLPGRRVRETLIIPRRLILPYQLSILTRASQQEPRWLDWALMQLGFIHGLAGLLLPAQSDYKPSLLWKQ